MSGQVLEIMKQLLKYKQTEFKSALKHLGVGRVNLKKMFEESQVMIPLYKNLFN